MIANLLSQYGLDWRTTVPIAALAGLALAMVALSFLILARAKAVVRRAEGRCEEASRKWEALLENCRRELAARQEDLDRQAADHALQTSPRAGINLSRRSQALRMHRKGEHPAQIAAALQIPQQEVELLVKVHQVVLGSI